MYLAKTNPQDRQRKPSQRAQQTREAIFSAAEQLFSERGFEGTATRDIAARAGVTAALVSFHGHNKRALFESVVEARARDLSAAREAALAAALAENPAPPLRVILACFIRPLLERAIGDDPGWRAYARLIALTSADPQWRELTSRCFDPTVARFTSAIAARYPGATRDNLAAGLVFSVSSMLALCTSTWRIEALAGRATDTHATGTCCGGYIDALITYTEAGLHALGCCQPDPGPAAR